MQTRAVKRNRGHRPLTRRTPIYLRVSSCQQLEAVQKIGEAAQQPGSVATEWLNGDEREPCGAAAAWLQAGGYTDKLIGRGQGMGLNEQSGQGRKRAAGGGKKWRAAL